MKQEKDIKQKVEDLGVAFEKFGKSPMSSRVMSYLLLAEPPHQSFDSIREFLGASKSAISIALKTLQNEDMVKYITFSGDRKRYFLVDGKGWLKNSEEKTKNLAVLNNLLEDVLVTREDSEYTDFNKDLEKMLEFQKFVTKEVEKILLKWQNK